jgi:hypothetical protein
MDWLLSLKGLSLGGGGGGGGGKHKRTASKKQKERDRKRIRPSSSYYGGTTSQWEEELEAQKMERVERYSWAEQRDERGKVTRTTWQWDIFKITDCNVSQYRMPRDCIYHLCDLSE